MNEPNHPFAPIERLLLRPRATGLLVTWVPEGPARSAGLAVGDTLVSAHEQPLRSVAELRAALQPVPPGEAAGAPAEDVVPLGVADATGGARTVAVPRAPLELGCVPVEANAPAWDERPDSDDDPVLRFVSARREVWFATRFGDTPGGYERLILEPRADGEGFALDHLAWLYGEQEGRAWSWRIRVQSDHRYDARLTTTRVACEHGTPGGATSRSDLSLAGDPPAWTGAREAAGGARETITRTAADARAVHTYAVPLLATTLPLRPGARRTFPLLMEGDGSVRARARLEVLGRDRCTVDGVEQDAWRVSWIHYGKPKGGEVFWVTDDRRLVRIDWGEDYAGCWCEERSRELVAAELPEGVTVE